jgi:hypothetical protein
MIDFRKSENPLNERVSSESERQDLNLRPLLPQSKIEFPLNLYR